MKKIHVKNYQVLINEENVSCGVAINIEHYKKVKIKDSNLKYSVDYFDHKIKIENTELEIILHNCDQQFMYYALKSFHLGIVLGKPNMITDQFIAQLK